MKTTNFLTILCFLFAGNVKSQLQVDTTYDVAQLVQNYFYGFGVITSNITFHGQLPRQLGQFNTGSNATDLEITSGIILSSGDVTDAPGPNSSGSTGTNTSSGSDTDLVILAGHYVYDKAILEFDFIPVADTVKFQWVFASEEYPEYVGSGYIDVFGFFLSGPGISGPYTNNTAANIALIPGTNTPVTIDNVNSGSNSDWYVDNTGGATIQYDGFTRKICSKFAVVHGQVYHIKLAVADAGDSSYDSAVFLESYSLLSLPVLSVSSETAASTGNKSVTNGCTDILYTFSIPYPILLDLKIPFTLSGNAVYGVDYSLNQDSIIIPAGDSSVTIIFHPLGGNSTVKTAHLVYNYFGEYTDTLTAAFFNSPLLDLGTNVTLCEGENITLNAGTGFNSYLWSTGETNQQITVDTSNAALGQNNIWVVASDTSCTKTDTVVIAFQNCVGVRYNETETDLKIFPNPATGHINILSSGPWQVNIYNMLGERIQTINTSRSNSIKLQSKGIYLVELINKNDRIIKQVVVE